MKFLKFVGLIVGMLLISAHVPLGMYINTGICLVALWKLVNDD